MFKYFIPTNITFFIIITTAFSCDTPSSKKGLTQVEMDSIIYDIESGGIGFDVKDGNEVDYNRGNTFLVLMDITNKGTTTALFDTSSFSLLDASDRHLTTSTKFMGLELAVVGESITRTFTIKPNITKKCMLTYEVPSPGNYTLEIISPKSERTEKIKF